MFQTDESAEFEQEKGSQSMGVDDDRENVRLNSQKCNNSK